MEFKFSGSRLTGRERALQRFFEIVPGLTSWTVLIGMFFIAFFKPLAAAVIMIAFFLYWLLRLLYLTIFLVLSYFKLSKEQGADWMKRVRDLDGLEDTGRVRPFSKDVYHLVIIPVAKEMRDVIEPGIKSLAEGTFPAKQIVVFLALEERASEEVKTGTREVLDAYKDKFFDMQIAVHPDGIVGEARAKGANTTFAAKKAAEYFKEKNIPFENVISSCFDSDTVVNPDYSASLT
ncbi:MAG: hypothetical protein ACE5JK_07210, partial [Candidatus Omnitrophota bacterium]